MTKILLAAAVAVAISAAPAFAADSMMKAPANEATMLCRTALPGEKPDATYEGKGIVCKSMGKMMMNGKMGPNTAGMDKAATDKAWQEWLQNSVLVPRSGDG
jgi:hypothetical protein